MTLCAGAVRVPVVVVLSARQKCAFCGRVEIARRVRFDKACAESGLTDIIGSCTAK